MAASTPLLPLCGKRGVPGSCMSESLALSQQTERNRHEAQGEGYEERRQGIAEQKQENESMQKRWEKQIRNKSHRRLQRQSRGKVEHDGRWPRPHQLWAVIKNKMAGNVSNYSLIAANICRLEGWRQNWSCRLSANYYKGDFKDGLRKCRLLWGKMQESWTKVMHMSIATLDNGNITYYSSICFIHLVFT